MPRGASGNGPPCESSRRPPGRILQTARWRGISGGVSVDCRAYRLLIGVARRGPDHGPEGPGTREGRGAPGALGYENLCAFVRKTPDKKGRSHPHHPLEKFCRSGSARQSSRGDRRCRGHLSFRIRVGWIIVLGVPASLPTIEPVNHFPTEHQGLRISRTTIPWTATSRPSNPRITSLRSIKTCESAQPRLPGPPRPGHPR